MRRKRKRQASKREPLRHQRVKQLQRELRTNEERWQAVINNPFMGITVIDQNHRFIMTNSTFQNMVG
jgi:PAS domain-containing protein